MDHSEIQLRTLNSNITDKSGDDHYYTKLNDDAKITMDDRSASLRRSKDSMLIMDKQTNLLEHSSTNSTLIIFQVTIICNLIAWRYYVHYQKDIHITNPEQFFNPYYYTKNTLLIIMLAVILFLRWLFHKENKRVLNITLKIFYFLLTIYVMLVIGVILGVQIIYRGDFRNVIISFYSGWYYWITEVLTSIFLLILFENFRNYQKYNCQLERVESQNNMHSMILLKREYQSQFKKGQKANKFFLILFMIISLVSIIMIIAMMQQQFKNLTPQLKYRYFFMVLLEFYLVYLLWRIYAGINENPENKEKLFNLYWWVFIVFSAKFALESVLQTENHGTTKVKTNKEKIPGFNYYLDYVHVFESGRIFLQWLWSLYFTSYWNLLDMKLNHREEYCEHMKSSKMTTTNQRTTDLIQEGKESDNVETKIVQEQKKYFIKTFAFVVIINADFYFRMYYIQSGQYNPRWMFNYVACVLEVIINLIIIRHMHYNKEAQGFQRLFKIKIAWYIVFILADAMALVLELYYKNVQIKQLWYCRVYQINLPYIIMIMAIMRIVDNQLERIDSKNHQNFYDILYS